MSRDDHTRLQNSSQEDCAQSIQYFHQPLAIELRARQLRQRFVLTPELARTLVALAFAGEFSA